MIVVSDTSPIINLAAINKLSLLPSLFQKVCIPPAVSSEIRVAGQGQPGSELIKNVDWIIIKEISNRNLVHALQLELDAGEAESIALALEAKAELLLIDERKGRKIAESFGIQYIGLIGVLFAAKDEGLISLIKPVIDDLISIAGFWIGNELYNYCLEQANEK